MKKITDIEWHDLPLEAISINSDSISLLVTPYNEETKNYDVFSLVLSSFSTISFSIEGQLEQSALQEMEIASFEHIESLGKLSGSIGILPANAGYWSITFKDASWVLREST